MKFQALLFRSCIVAALVLASAILLAAQNAPSAAGGNPPVGKFTGNFLSHHFPSFPLTITISQDSNGKFTGVAALGSRCIANATLTIAVNGSNISLAGSDPEGDNITFKGMIQPGGTQLTLDYIVNGSASGRCETDQGTGTLFKQ